MSDELVKRLRDFDPHLHEWEVVDEAADRIEALTAERDRLREALSGVLWMAEEWYLYGGDETTFAPDCKQAIEAARAALKGETP